MIIEKKQTCITLLLVTECLRGVVVGEAEELDDTAPWDTNEFMLSTDGSLPPGSRRSASEEPNGETHSVIRHQCTALHFQLIYGMGSLMVDMSLVL